MCVCAFKAVPEHLVLPWLSYESFIGFRHPRRENALNVSAIIPLITAACSRAKPGPDRDKELQVTQSIWGLLISVTCLSGRLEEKQQRLLTHARGPATAEAFTESAATCVWLLQAPPGTRFRQASSFTGKGDY